MTTKLTKLSLATMLSLGACVHTPYTGRPFFANLEDRVTPSLLPQPSVSNSGNNYAPKTPDITVYDSKSRSNSYSVNLLTGQLDDGYRKEQPSTNIAGLVDFSAGNDSESFRVGLPLLPLIQFNIRQGNHYRNENFYTDGVDSFRDISQSSYWMVGSGFNNGYLDIEQPIPLSTLGKALKRLVWDSDIARPARVLSEGFSDLSQGPTSFIFGAGANSDLEFKLDTNRVGLLYQVKFIPDFNGNRWKLEIEYQHGISNEAEETAVRAQIGVDF